MMGLTPSKISKFQAKNPALFMDRYLKFGLKRNAENELLDKAKIASIVLENYS